MPFDISDQFTNEPLTADQLHDIPHYTLELTQHVATKGVQAGALLGTAIGAIQLVRNRPANWPTGLVRLGRTAALSAAVTALASTAAMAVVLQREGWNDYRIYDRAYRLRHNSFQQRCDRWSAVGGVGGAAVLQLVPVGGVSRLAVAVAGAALGVGLGVLGHVATMPSGEEVKAAVKSGVVAVETVGKELEQPNPPLVKRG